MLDGKISFKVIWNGDIEDEWGDKWFFYHDKSETPEEDTIEKFCNNLGIVGCMNMEIDDLSMDVNLDSDGPGTINYHMYVYRKEFENER